VRCVIAATSVSALHPKQPRTHDFLSAKTIFQADFRAGNWANRPC